MTDPGPPPNPSPLPPPGPGLPPPPPPPAVPAPPQPQPQPQPQQPRPAQAAGPPAWLGLAALVATAAAVSLEENGTNAWSDIGVWAAFAIAAAAATWVPALHGSLGLGVERAWQVAAGGAAGLGAYWVLFVLPTIGRNVSFLATVALVLAVAAAWNAPGRPDAGSGEPPALGS